MIPLTGWAAERFGPRRVWMTVVAAFVVTSALCGLAWSAESLIGFRVLQGLAGGMIMPVGMITLAQAAGPARMGRVMSVVGVPMLLAPVFGPVIGGLHRREPLVALDLLRQPAGRRRRPGAARGGCCRASVRAGRDRPTDERPPLDLRGLALLSPGVALLVFGLASTGRSAASAPRRSLAPIVLGVVLLVAFVVHALRSTHPLVDIRLFRGRGSPRPAGRRSSSASRCSAR